MARDIDLDFLRGEEGFSLGGIVPMTSEGTPHPNSGPTFGTGIDMTQQSAQSLIAAGVEPSTVEQLGPLLGKGLKGEDAMAAIQKYNIQLNQAQADQMDRAIINRDTERLASQFSKASGREFDDLPREMQTVLASVGHQYGDLPGRTPNFWKQMTKGEHDKALKNLRNFGDDFPSRRNREADLFQKAMIDDFLRGNDV